MSPEGDIPMTGDGIGEELPSGAPNGTINIDDDSDDDFSDDDHGDGDGLGGYDGYQLLAQDNDPESLQDDVAGGTPNVSGSAQVDLPSHLANLVPTRESQPDPAARVSYRDTGAEQKSRVEAMAEDEQIRTAMSGITLPPANIPSWVGTLDEGEWKEMLSKMVKDQKGTDGRPQNDPNR